jgi:hypothetical protein
LSPPFSLDIYVVADVVIATVQPGNEWHNCYSDEHYLPTLFNVSVQKLVDDGLLFSSTSQQNNILFRKKNELLNNTALAFVASDG